MREFALVPGLTKIMNTADWRKVFQAFDTLPDYRDTNYSSYFVTKDSHVRSGKLYYKKVKLAAGGYEYQACSHYLLEAGIPDVDDIAHIGKLSTLGEYCIAGYTLVGWRKNGVTDYSDDNKFLRTARYYYIKPDGTMTKIDPSTYSGKSITTFLTDTYNNRIFKRNVTREDTDESKILTAGPTYYNINFELGALTQMTGVTEGKQLSDYVFTLTDDLKFRRDTSYYARSIDYTFLTAGEYEYKKLVAGTAQQVAEGKADYVNGEKIPEGSEYYCMSTPIYMPDPSVVGLLCHDQPSGSEFYERTGSRFPYEGFMAIATDKKSGQTRGGLYRCKRTQYQLSEDTIRNWDKTYYEYHKESNTYVARIGLDTDLARIYRSPTGSTFIQYTADTVFQNNVRYYTDVAGSSIITLGEVSEISKTETERKYLSGGKYFIYNIGGTNPIRLRESTVTDLSAYKFKPGDTIYPHGIEDQSVYTITDKVIYTGDLVEASGKYVLGVKYYTLDTTTTTSFYKKVEDPVPGTDIPEGTYRLVTDLFIAAVNTLVADCNECEDIHVCDKYRAFYHRSTTNVWEFDEPETLYGLTTDTKFAYEAGSLTKDYYFYIGGSSGSYNWKKINVPYTDVTDEMFGYKTWTDLFYGFRALVEGTDYHIGDTIPTGSVFKANAAGTAINTTPCTGTYQMGNVYHVRDTSHVGTLIGTDIETEYYFYDAINKRVSATKYRMNSANIGKKIVEGTAYHKQNMTYFQMSDPNNQDWVSKFTQFKLQQSPTETLMAQYLSIQYKEATDFDFDASTTYYCVDKTKPVGSDYEVLNPKKRGWYEANPSDGKVATTSSYSPQFPTYTKITSGNFEAGVEYYKKATIAGSTYVPMTPGTDYTVGSSISEWTLIHSGYQVFTKDAFASLGVTEDTVYNPAKTYYAMTGYSGEGTTAKPWVYSYTKASLTLVSPKERGWFKLSGAGTSASPYVMLLTSDTSIGTGTYYIHTEGIAMHRLSKLSSQVTIDATTHIITTDDGHVFVPVTAATDYMYTYYVFNGDDSIKSTLSEYRERIGAGDEDFATLIPKYRGWVERAGTAGSYTYAASNDVTLRYDKVYCKYIKTSDTTVELVAPGADTKYYSRTGAGTEASPYVFTRLKLNKENFVYTELDSSWSFIPGTDYYEFDPTVILDHGRIMLANYVYRWDGYVNDYEGRRVNSQATAVYWNNNDGTIPTAIDICVKFDRLGTGGDGVTMPSCVSLYTNSLEGESILLDEYYEELTGIYTWEQFFIDQGISSSHVYDTDMFYDDSNLYISWKDPELMIKKDDPTSSPDNWYKTTIEIVEASGAVHQMGINYSKNLYADSYYVIAFNSSSSVATDGTKITREMVENGAVRLTAISQTGVVAPTTDFKADKMVYTESEPTFVNIRSPKALPGIVYYNPDTGAQYVDKNPYVSSLSGTEVIKYQDNVDIYRKVGTVYVPDVIGSGAGYNVGDEINTNVSAYVKCHASVPERTLAQLIQSGRAQKMYPVGTYMELPVATWNSGSSSCNRSRVVAYDNAKVVRKLEYGYTETTDVSPVAGKTYYAKARTTTIECTNSAAQYEFVKLEGLTPTIAWSDLGEGFVAYEIGLREEAGVPSNYSHYKFYKRVDESTAIAPSYVELGTLAQAENPDTPIYYKDGRYSTPQYIPYTDDAHSMTLMCYYPAIRNKCLMKVGDLTLRDWLNSSSTTGWTGLVGQPQGFMNANGNESVAKFYLNNVRTTVNVNYSSTGYSYSCDKFWMPSASNVGLKYLIGLNTAGDTEVKLTVPNEGAMMAYFDPTRDNNVTYPRTWPRVNKETYEWWVRTLAINGSQIKGQYIATDGNNRPADLTTGAYYPMACFVLA